MVSPVLVGITLTVIIYWICEFIFARPKNFPPGPTRVPIFGNYAYLIYKNAKNVPQELAEWTKRYNSKIISVFTGLDKNVVTGDINLIKEILTGKEFDGRPFSFPIQIRSWGKRLGIFFTQGDYWLEQRRFTLRYLRDFGFGRRMPKLEKIKEEEIQKMIHLIENGPETESDYAVVKKNRLICVPQFFSIPFINAFTALLIGRALSKEHNELLRETGKGALMFQHSTNPTGKLLAILPWIRYFLPNYSGYNNLIKSHQKLLDYLNLLIEERKQLNEEKCEGFIDFYLKEIQAREKLDTATPFSEEQLLLASVDFLFPPASVLGVTMQWLLRRLLDNPEVQDKMYSEIVEAVGVNRFPNLDDRINLDYCEATLREIMRSDTSAPLGVPHVALVDTTLDGFQIPKGTAVITNLGQMHLDETIWKNPEEFQPERFLNSDRKLDLKLDKSIPFGLGRRVCAGETFARNTLFLYMVALVQNYKFVSPKGYHIPDIKQERRTELISSLPDFWVECIPR